MIINFNTELLLNDISAILDTSHSAAALCATIDRLWQYKKDTPQLHDFLLEKTNQLKHDALDQGEHRVAFAYNALQYQNTDFKSAEEKETISYISKIVKCTMSVGDHNAAVLYDDRKDDYLDVRSEFSKERFVEDCRNTHLMKDKKGNLIGFQALKKKITKLEKHPHRQEECKETIKSLENLRTEQELKKMSLPDFVAVLKENDAIMRPLPSITKRYAVWS